MNKKLAGQIILESGSKLQDFEDDVSEYRRSMEPSTMEKVYNTAYEAKHHDLYRNKDFYVVMALKIERLLLEPQLVYIARRSCPTPVYMQSVWKYISATDELEFLWSIPHQILYHHILREPMKYLNDKETADLAKFVILMESGQLLDWVKKENGNKRDGVIRINNQETQCLMS